MTPDQIKVATTALAAGSPIETMLVISTAHATEETAKALRDEAAGRLGGLIVYPHGEYGWMIYVAILDQIDAEDVPEDLMTVCQYAHGLGCVWVLLDRDAAEIDDLPTWEW